MQQELELKKVSEDGEDKVDDLEAKNKAAYKERTIQLEEEYEKMLDEVRCAGLGWMGWVEGLEGRK
jgi:hypothetical protein